MKKSRRAVTLSKKKDQRTLIAAAVIGSWIVTVGNLVMVGLYLLRK